MAKVSTRGVPTHYKPITYGKAIEIIGFDYGSKDYVLWRWTGEKKTHRSVIYYTSIGTEPYFKVNGMRHHLNEFMRF